MATIPPPEGEEPVMPAATPKAPSPLSFPDFRYFWLARFTAVMATIAMVVVIGYQLYDTARSDYGMSIKEARSEEHTSELQSLMRISYAVFCLKKKTIIS